MIDYGKIVILLVLIALCVLLTKKMRAAEKKKYNTISKLQIALHICCCVTVLLAVDVVRDSVSADLVGGAHDPFLAEYYVEDYSPLRRRLRWYERVSNWFERAFLGHEFIN